VSHFHAKPELETAGWLPRLPIEDLVYFDQWGREGHAGAVGRVGLGAVADVAQYACTSREAPPMERAVLSNSTCCCAGVIRRNSAPGCEK
jgi:hypothetical protein